MRDKASQLFQMEVTQNMLHAASGENQVVKSILSVLSCASSEVLNEDPDTLRAKQGQTLNKGIFSLNTLLRDLSSTPQGEYANYSESLLNSLARDVFGGNSLAIGIFCLQFGDPIGSAMTMRALEKCKSIMNFPVQNDNRVLGLLRKYRVEIQNLQQLANSVGLANGNPHPGQESSFAKISELEQRLVDQKISNLKGGDEKERLIARLNDMKSKFNDLIKSKAEL